MNMTKRVRNERSWVAKSLYLLGVCCRYAKLSKKRVRTTKTSFRKATPYGRRSIDGNFLPRYDGKIAGIDHDLQIGD